LDLKLLTAISAFLLTNSPNSARVSCEVVVLDAMFVLHRLSESGALIGRAPVFQSSDWLLV